MKTQPDADHLLRDFRSKIFVPLLDELDPLFMIEGSRTLSDIVVKPGAQNGDLKVAFNLNVAETGGAAESYPLWTDRQHLVEEAVDRHLTPYGWRVGQSTVSVDVIASSVWFEWELTKVSNEHVEATTGVNDESKNKYAVPIVALVLVLGLVLLTQLGVKTFLAYGITTIGIICCVAGLLTKKGGLVGLGAILIVLRQMFL
jgi:hypothetical protein